MQGIPLIKSDYIPATIIYQVKKPEISSGSVYYFETDSGLKYQVTFGKKKNNYLGNIINFSVIDDDFEDEYSETNKGEAFRIISTMIEIFKIYHENHPYSNSYEFSGEFKEKRDIHEHSIRTRLYYRTARNVIDLNYWNISLEGNRVVLAKKRD
jgi:hypothetical protein